MHWGELTKETDGVLRVERGGGKSGTSTIGRETPQENNLLGLAQRERLSRYLRTKDRSVRNSNLGVQVILGVESGDFLSGKSKKGSWERKKTRLGQSQGVGGPCFPRRQKKFREDQTDRGRPGKNAPALK